MNGKDLRATLRRHGITQVRFAKAIGRNQRTVRSWIAGRLPVPEIVELVVESLEYVSLDELRALR